MGRSVTKYTKETNTFPETSCKEINIFAGLLQETFYHSNLSQGMLI